jgi:hypothetical protein
MLNAIADWGVVHRDLYEQKSVGQPAGTMATTAWSRLNLTAGIPGDVSNMRYIR